MEVPLGLGYVRLKLKVVEKSEGAAAWGCVGRFALRQGASAGAKSFPCCNSECAAGVGNDRPQPYTIVNLTLHILGTLG